jgi:hypothetical protein
LKLMIKSDRSLIGTWATCFGIDSGCREPVASSALSQQLEAATFGPGAIFQWGLEHSDLHGTKSKVRLIPTVPM